MATAPRRGKVARHRATYRPAQPAGRSASSPRRKERRPAGKARSGNGSLIFLFVGFVAAAVVTAAPAAAPIALGGMLPTLVVIALDWSQGRSVACTVGGMNVAGVVPFLPALWCRRGALISPVDMLGDTTAVIVMYAAAAAGWLLIALLPALFAVLEREEAAYRQVQLRRAQQLLEEEWGQGVVGAEVSTTCPSSVAPG
ncbi:MAG: hypothetical protein IPK78_05120 [Rhodospirillales bacterium]|nr:hypothetical protein [Rhodospirillales bacterium]